jgi:hypothetical protein
MWVHKNMSGVRMRQIFSRFVGRCPTLGSDAALPKKGESYKKPDKFLCTPYKLYNQEGHYQLFHNVKPVEKIDSSIYIFRIPSQNLK